MLYIFEVGYLIAFICSEKKSDERAESSPHAKDSLKSSTYQRLEVPIGSEFVWDSSHTGSLNAVADFFVVYNCIVLTIFLETLFYVLWLLGIQSHKHIQRSLF